MEKIMWLVLGATAFVASLRAPYSRRARYIGRGALGLLFIVFGAVTNAVYLAFAPEYYENFADASPFRFVQNTWESLVVPHLAFFITLLIVAEATAGVLILAGGRKTRAGLLLLIGFHAGQLPFGGVLWVWAPVMLVALALLLRAERRATEGSIVAPHVAMPADPSLDKSHFVNIPAREVIHTDTSP